MVHAYVLGYKLLVELEYEGMQAKLAEVLEPVYKLGRNPPKHAQPFVFENEGLTPPEWATLRLGY